MSTDNQPNPKWQEIVWYFLRGDLPVSEFEQWVYDTEQLQLFMRRDLYVKALETNYRDQEQVHELKIKLKVWIDQLFPRSCPCLTWRDNLNLPLGFENLPDAFWRPFQVLKARTAWIDLARCKHCGQAWYVATDTLADIYYLQRLTESQVQAIEQDQWPSTFDAIETVWPD